MGEEANLELIGRVVGGKFLVLEHVGGGAMGEVYKARHTTLDSLVALKVMRKDLSEDPMFAERFYREAKAASRLEHPNSVRVVDHGREDDGLTYIAMEYLAGRDLLRVISDDWPLTEHRIIEILLQVLSALGVAHTLGVIHRDLKPENIMMLETTDDEGHVHDLVKVCDFGIAKISDPRGFQSEGGMPAGRALTTHGTLVGTPEYMSPEQARGDTLDARSDLYSVGVILYQLLTGRVPFVAENALGVVLKQVTDEPEPPSLNRPGMSIQLETICLKALRKKPSDRYSTAKEMRADLRALLAGTPSMRVHPHRLGFESSPIILGEPRIPSSADTLQVPIVADPSSQPGSQSGSQPNSQPSSQPFSQPGMGRPVPLETQTGTAMSPVATTKSNGLLYAAIAVGLVAMLGVGGMVAASRLRQGIAPVSSRAEPTAIDLTAMPLSPLVAPLPSGMSSGTEPQPSARPNPSSPGGPSARVGGTPTASARASAAPSATTAPPPTASTAPPPSAPFDASRASVNIGMISASGVQQVAVRSKMRTLQPSLSACYRTALATKGSRVDGTATLNLSIDEKGRVNSCVTSGAEQLPDAVRCFQRSVVGSDLGASAVEGHGGTAEVWLTLKAE